MAFNGSGTFNRLYDWTTDEGNGINIEASRMDGEDDGFATGLSTCITKDGQTTITANIPFNSKKITGLANGSARTDSIALGQVQDGTYGTLGTLGGSADTYTATPSPAITAYATGMEFNMKVNADNTGASTLNVSAVGAKDVKKYDGAGAKVALVAGDLQQDQYYKVIYDGTDMVLKDAPIQYPTIQKFTSGSGTYTTPTGTRYIRVRMVGAGAGGSGSGASATSAVNGSNGGNTTFGSSLLVANGGSAGSMPGNGGAGGTASLGTGPIGTIITGGQGEGYADVPAVGYYMTGGAGGSSHFGYQPGGTANAAAVDADANTGKGGGGGGGGSAVGMRSGLGGGAGGYVDAIITAPSATYSYAVGAAGAAGSAGTSGFAGGAGGSGYIEVTEYY